MKKHISILMLFSKSTFYKILILFFLMISVESFFFWQTLNRTLTAFTTREVTAFSLEAMFTSSYIPWIFGICFLLMTVLLSSTGCDFGSKQGYTLRRLNIPDRSVFLWQTLYNAGCYLLLWLVQTIVALLLCQLYITHSQNFLAENPVTTDPFYTDGIAYIINPRITNQTVFLAFYRSNFLHSLLPLGNIIRWLRNLLFVLGLGTGAAAFPYYQRRGQTSPAILILAAMCFFTFSDKLGANSLDLLSLLMGIYAIRTIYRILIKERKDEAYEK